MCLLKLDSSIEVQKLKDRSGCSLEAAIQVQVLYSAGKVSSFCCVLKTFDLK